MTRHRQHDAQGLLCYGDRVGPRSIHYSDTRACGRFEVDVVHPNPGPADDSQLLGVLQQLGIHLHCGTHDQRIRGFQLRWQISVQLLRCDDVPGRLTQQIGGA
jgi:hypothetical protein